MNQWTSKQLRNAILRWYSSNKRNLYWRNHKVSAYHFLILEMLLRKTRAEKVEEVFLSLKKLLLRPEIIPNGKLKKIRKMIQPLGLAKIRTEAIMRVSEIIYKKHKKKVPNSYEELIKMPHVGRYAANATLCFVFNERRPIVDSNIARLYSRVFNMIYPREIHKDEELWRFAEKILPKKKFKEFNYSLLDLCALICKSKNPECERCPIRKNCFYFNNLI